ncbi:MAG: hypothetical protein HYR60_18155, partial [Acidobacteria bacterium]|nr:hypothetical protein [Acidobacteriota bacterium]
MRRLLLILAAAAAAQEAEKPAPGERLDLSGSADLGYRWRDVRGNSQAYRSVVDLGEGPKLFGLDFSLAGKSRKLFDRINVRALGWGGDPYTTAEVDLSRQGSYRLTWDYRNLAYFNFLPSFANPRLERGSFLSQRAFDTHRKLNDLRLDLFPGRRVIPYLAYTRDSGSGSGITTFVTEGNEYPVANRLADKTDHYRGGVRLELGRFHATVEEGGTAFKDDQRAFTSQRNLGNRATPIFGQTLELTRLEQAWGIRGDSSYTQLLFTASPASWADLSGHFLYSNPSTTSNYFQNSAGRFVDLNSLLFVAEQQERLLSGARQPHTSGDLAAEIRPLGRVRILESWMTDRLHQTGEASLGLPDVEYNQQQLEVLCDLSSRLTLRGGHRYVWGQARVLAPVLRLRLGAEEGELRRNVLLAVATFRAARKLSDGVHAEGASGDRVYFRTSLNDY